MEDGIEIYVRKSADRTLLNLHVPAHLKEQFIAALESGSFSDSCIPMALELSPLPDWITDQDLRGAATLAGTGVHLRIPLTAINLSFSDQS
jgi:hypothetical protein